MVDERDLRVLVRSAKVAILLLAWLGALAAELYAEWRFQARYPSPWDNVVLVVAPAMLVVGLIVVYRRTDALWPEMVAASIVCLLVALCAWFYMGLTYACARGDCL